MEDKGLFDEKTNSEHVDSQTNTLLGFAPSQNMFTLFLVLRTYVYTLLFSK